MTTSSAAIARDEAWPQGPSSPEQIERVASSLAHPVRSKLLNMLALRPGAGVDELAEWGHEPVRSVRKHLNILVEHGLVEVDAHERRRGVVKRHYVNAIQSVMTEGQDAALSERDRRLYTFGILRLIFDQAGEALAAGTLTARPDRVIANTPAEVDQRGWQELADLHQELVERVQMVVRESRERRASSGEDPIAVMSSLLFVERAPLR